MSDTCLSLVSPPKMTKTRRREGSAEGGKEPLLPLLLLLPPLPADRALTPQRRQAWPSTCLRTAACERPAKAACWNRKLVCSMPDTRFTSMKRMVPSPPEGPPAGGIHQPSIRAKSRRARDPKMAAASERILAMAAGRKRGGEKYLTWKGTGYIYEGRGEMQGRGESAMRNVHSPCKTRPNSKNKSASERRLARLGAQTI